MYNVYIVSYLFNAKKNDTSKLYFQKTQSLNVDFAINMISKFSYGWEKRLFQRYQILKVKKKGEREHMTGRSFVAFVIQFRNFVTQLLFPTKFTFVSPFARRKQRGSRKEGEGRKNISWKMRNRSRLLCLRFKYKNSLLLTLDKIIGILFLSRYTRCITK